MKKERNIKLWIGLGLLVCFVIWTIMVRNIDIQPIGPKGTTVGFATLNWWFHGLTGVHMDIYTITDWLGLVPFFVCTGFGILGLVQWIKRKNILKVDFDIIALGVYYIVVIAAYVIFEMKPIDYRPVLINGVLEASYPSSTTLLVLSVMPTLKFQLDRRVHNPLILTINTWFVIAFSAFMVIGRLIAGVHWLTDIMGGILVSTGLFLIYVGIVDIIDSRLLISHKE